MRPILGKILEPYTTSVFFLERVSRTRGIYNRVCFRDKAAEIQRDRKSIRNWISSKASMVGLDIEFNCVTSTFES